MGHGDQGFVQGQEIAAPRTVEEVALKGVTKTFGDLAACSDVNLSIARGEFFTFLGPSGCGKTTILRLIAGFLTPQSGVILLNGRDITTLPPEKREVGMVFQNYALFPYLTVAGNIEYGLKIRGLSKTETRATVERYLSMVGLSGFEDRDISELSGGEQQRVALARSLAVEPRVLLLDEPLSNLDARLRDRTRAELKNLQKELGVTTVFVTHDQNEALTLSDRIAVFNKGRVVQVGTPAEIYGQPKNGFVAGFVGDTNLLTARWSNGAAHTPDGLDIQVNAGSLQGKFLSIRPQDVVLSAGPLDEPNCFAGRVVDVQLNGVWIEYLVRVNDTPLRAAVLNRIGDGVTPQAGDAVFVSLPRRGIRTLNE